MVKYASLVTLSLCSIALTSLGCGLLAGLGDHEPAPAATGGGGHGQGGFEPPVALLTDEDLPRPLVIDKERLYWATEGSKQIRSIPKGGGSAVTLAATGQSTPQSIAADVDFIYWTETSPDCDIHGDRVMGLPKESPAEVPTEFYSACDRGLRSLVVDGVALYWTEAEGRIRKRDKGPTTALVFANNLIAPFGLAQDAFNLYWTRYEADQPITLKNKSGDEPPVVLADHQDKATGIAVDSEAVYWITDGGQVMKLVKADAPDAAGGKPGEIVQLAAQQNHPEGIALDATHVYWTNAGDNRIMTISKMGGAPEVLAEGQNYPAAIAVDESGIYWTNYIGGQIMTMKRR